MINITFELAQEIIDGLAEKNNIPYKLEVCELPYNNEECSIICFTHKGLENNILSCSYNSNGTIDFSVYDIDRSILEDSEFNEFGFETLKEALNYSKTVTYFVDEFYSKKSYFENAEDERKALKEYIINAKS